MTAKSVEWLSVVPFRAYQFKTNREPFVLADEFACVTEGGLLSLEHWAWSVNSSSHRLRE